MVAHRQATKIPKSPQGVQIQTRVVARRRQAKVPMSPQGVGIGTANLTILSSNGSAPGRRRTRPTKSKEQQLGVV